jgi:hypothetical protein
LYITPAELINNYWDTHFNGLATLLSSQCS